MRVMMAILLTLSLVACGERYRDNQVAFEGIKFDADLSTDKNDAFAFRVSVKKEKKTSTARARRDVMRRQNSV